MTVTDEGHWDWYERPDSELTWLLPDDDAAPEVG